MMHKPAEITGNSRIEKRMPRKRNNELVPVSAMTSEKRLV